MFRLKNHRQVNELRFINSNQGNKMVAQGQRSMGNYSLPLPLIPSILTGRTIEVPTVTPESIPCSLLGEDIGDDDMVMESVDQLVNILDEVEDVLSVGKGTHTPATSKCYGVQQELDPLLLEPTPIATDPAKMRFVQQDHNSTAGTSSPTPSIDQYRPPKNSEWYNDDDMKDLLNPFLVLDCTTAEGENKNEKKRGLDEDDEASDCFEFPPINKKHKPEPVASSLPPLPSSLFLATFQDDQQVPAQNSGNFSTLDVATPTTIMQDMAPSSMGNAEEQFDADLAIKHSKNHQVNRYRMYQARQWMERYKDLVKYQQKYGHCCVPHKCTEYPELSVWVKRQRYQYKLKCKKQHSTLSNERQALLDGLNFVWDSHTVAWEEKFHELCIYKQHHGNCDVPSNYEPNPALAVWVKCQRRQYKIYNKEGRFAVVDDDNSKSSDDQDGGRSGTINKSAITKERIQKLDSIGFSWKLRR